MLHTHDLRMREHKRRDMNVGVLIFREEVEPILASHVAIIDVLVVQRTLDRISGENVFETHSTCVQKVFHLTCSILCHSLTHLLLGVEMELLLPIFELHHVGIDLQLALLPCRLEQLLRKPDRNSAKFSSSAH